MGSFGSILSKIISIVIIGLLVWFISCKLLPSTIQAYKKFRENRKQKKLEKSQNGKDSKNPTEIEKKED